MILRNIFFFYLGCAFNFPQINCVDVAKILNSNVVTDPGLLNKVEYAVLILTRPNNTQQRYAIRDTWANLSSNIIIENNKKLYRWNQTSTGKHLTPEFVKVFFVIGTQGLNAVKLIYLGIENNINNDLLLLDTLQESYENLSIKLLHSIKWLNDNLKRLKYLIKCDDDSFVRTDLIIRDIEAFAPQMNAPEIANYVSYKKSHTYYRGLYWGFFTGSAQIRTNGKYVETKWFLSNKYLPFAFGGGYVISASIINYIAKNADILSHYNSEDATMGVWTAALKGINRVHDIRFDTEAESGGCEHNMLIRHDQTPKNMFAMYKTLVDSGGQKLCTNPRVVRKPYMYNWNVLPNACCKLVQ